MPIASKAFCGLMDNGSRSDVKFYFKNHSHTPIPLQKNLPIQHSSLAQGWVLTTSGGSTPTLRHNINATLTVFILNLKKTKKNNLFQRYICKNMLTVQKNQYFSFRSETVKVTE